MKYFLGTLLFSISMFTSAQNITRKAIPLDGDASLDRLISAAADKELVLLGEASHGTHEYYVWRDKISRRLISEHDFSFIAVEGDFASLYHLNRYVKNLDGAANSAQEVLLKLDRWPTWMWANEEVVALAEWLRDHNDSLAQDEKVGFYGMDVYDEWNSKKEVLDLLETTDQAAYEYVKEQYACFEPHKGDSWRYADAVRGGKANCATATKNVVDYIRNNRANFPKLSDDAFFYLLQNTIVVHNAEEFYRESLASRGDVSWNSRVHHMHGTVNDLLNLYGVNSKGIVWAHNTHIGDAEYTNMRNSGQKNIGQLSREGLGGDNVFLIGLTTYEGKVMAGPS
ncbi:MAG: erythromycin esterase family protein, partial [Bacteroidales bacterium]|nr:erythromycin esterase family protein [Bacteroidales bacterium]